MKASIFTIIQY